MAPDAGAPSGRDAGRPADRARPDRPDARPELARAELPASGHAGRARGRRADARPERPGSGARRARCPAAAGPASGPGAPEDRNRPSTEPPKLSSGDPLAG